ncbi:hypothetical protein G4O51_13050 [Candidatus Bathyarchaeota archaeon A05DMB-2]|nr:hypothetical protein [Candidatus Bathyarchaeota archaeon A05DMB-2]
MQISLKLCLIAYSKLFKIQKVVKAPVAVSKALHLLAPKFFPLWDNDISKAYGCYWYYSEASADKYLEFMGKMRTLAENVLQSFMNMEGGSRETAMKTICERCSRNVPFTKSLLKIIDEYNYSRYSKNWVK